MKLHIAGEVGDGPRVWTVCGCWMTVQDVVLTLDTFLQFPEEKRCKQCLRRKAVSA